MPLIWVKIGAFFPVALGYSWHSSCYCVLQEYIIIFTDFQFFYFTSHEFLLSLSLSSWLQLPSIIFFIFVIVITTIVASPPTPQFLYRHYNCHQ